MNRIYILLSFLFLSMGTWGQNPDEVFDIENFDFSKPINSIPKISLFAETGLSANAYSGDLSSYTKWSSVFHFGLRFNKAYRINSRIGISTGFLTGENRFYTFDDGSEPKPSPNTFFRSNIFSFEYELMYNIIKKRNFMLYISQGIGLMRFVVKNAQGDNLFDLQNTRALDETYGNFAFMLPTGIGTNYILKNGFGLGVHASFINTQSDYLDNISQWGNKVGNDNAFRFKVFVMIPVNKIPLMALPPRPQNTYTK